jgi:pyruvate dehydrogenase E2 component (dihydrolipoamide acetyltransferase)
MSTDVRVPTTGNAGEDAVIVDWNVAVGAQVNAGDVLVTLETAKSTIEVEAPASGQVLKIMFESGDEVPEHEVLAILGEAGEEVSSGSASDANDMGATAPAHPGPATVVKQDPVETAGPVRHVASGERVKASPRARIIAERSGLDLSTISGTGPGGRIIIFDVLEAKKSGAAAPVAIVETPPVTVLKAPADTAASVFSGDQSTVVQVRGARKVTAQRMQASLQGTAQVTITRYANASTLLRYSARLRTVTDAASLPKIGVNDLLLFATSRAVARHPAANSWFDWEGIRQFSTVNLGFAVDTGQALLVPVIPAAEKLSLADLAASAKAAIEKSRAGKLTTQEMEGGTFTVSNLGGLGVHWFTPVLNTPQSCILGIGGTHQSHSEGPSLLPLSLTFDHRAIDGAVAAALLADIAASIETVDVLAAF